MKKIFSLIIFAIVAIGLHAANHKRVIIHANGGENTTDAGYLVADVGGSVLISEPIRAGYTFAGWTSSNDYSAVLCLMNSDLRGAGSEEIIFDGATYYDLGTEYMYTDRLTVNLWAYMDNWADYAGRRIISCTEGGGWGFEPSTSGHFNIKMHDGTGYIDAKSAGVLNYADLTTGWHMFTLTFDGNNVKGFVDGQLIGIGPRSTTGAIHYNTNSILLGAEPTTSNVPAETPCYFKGKIRNLSIVRAALSIPGVKDLYKEMKAETVTNPRINRYIMPANNKTLKASWKANAATTLTLDAAGGKNTMDANSYSKPAGSALTITKPIREGYTFLHWDKTTSQYISNYQGIPCSSAEEVTFNGTSTYYALGRDYMYEDVITVNVWAYMDDWSLFSTNGMRLISCTETGGFNIEPKGTGQIQFTAYAKGLEYKRAVGSMLWSELTAGWHMFTLTFDGNRVRGYVDGELQGMSDLFQSGKMGYHATNGLLIGAEPSSENKPANTPHYFQGKMKHLAIMHAAITSDEVALLYKEAGVARQYFPTSNHTLKAVWQTNPSSTLTINAASGVNTMASNTYSKAAGTALTITNPTRTGYAFVGWDKETSQNIINYQGYTCSSPQEVIFDGATHYDLGREYMYEDAITINLWAHMENWADYNGMRIFSCTQTGGLNMEGTTNITFAGYDKAVGYKNAKANFGWGDLGTGWHMITYVFDGMNVRGYIDGKQVAISDGYVSGKIGYHTTNHLLIGAEAYNSAGAIESNPRYFKGKIKNFGIVPTAISADEVALLYANQGIARYYFLDTNKTITAKWEVDNSFTTAIQQAGNKTFTYYTADKSLYITGIIATQIDLYNLSGQQVCSIKGSNILPLPIPAGVYIAHITDSESSLHTIKVIVE